MNTLTMPTKSSGGLSDLRASIFPPEDPVLNKIESSDKGSLNCTVHPHNNIATNAVAVANIEAAISFKSALNKQKVSNLSASYRSSLSTSYRITPHRLGSSFIDFMHRFHEID